MCLILFALDYHPAYKLILLANRDEFYNRPAVPLDYWPDTPVVLAGRDLKGKGTWLGVNRKGCVAAITNYRDPAKQIAGAPSRGLLVSNYLTCEKSSPEYLEGIEAIDRRYNGFNLLVGDPDKLCYFSNHASGIQKVSPGVHGLSNHLLDTPWPKVVTGKKRLETILANTSEVNSEELFRLMADRSVPEDSQLPDTGVGLAWERVLAPIFIASPGYGTRCTSVLMVEACGRIRFMERTYLVENNAPSKIFTRTFILEPGS